MTRMFPFQSQTDGVAEPQLIELNDTAADAIFEALSSETARSMLASLYEDPRTASELADQANTSLQNVQYHLDKFESAGLIESVGEVYSEQGNEMMMYAPAHDPLVLTARSEDGTQSFKSVVKQLLGAVGILAVVSVILDAILRRGGPIFGDIITGEEGSSGGGAGGGTTPNITPTPDHATEWIQGLPPGLFIFIGSVVALLLVVVWMWYRKKDIWRNNTYS